VGKAVVIGILVGVLDGTAVLVGVELLTETLVGDEVCIDVVVDARVEMEAVVGVRLETLVVVGVKLGTEVVDRVDVVCVLLGGMRVTDEVPIGVKVVPLACTGLLVINGLLLVIEAFWLFGMVESRVTDESLAEARVVPLLGTALAVTVAGAELVSVAVTGGPLEEAEVSGRSVAPLAGSEDSPECVSVANVIGGV
jgi:hypothetical protein